MTFNKSIELPLNPVPAAPSSPWVAFWISSVAVFLVSLDGTMLFSIFGSLSASFPKSTAADMSWVLNAYILTFGGLLLLGARAGDLLGRRRTFLFGIALFSAYTRNLYPQDSHRLIMRSMIWFCVPVQAWSCFPVRASQRRTLPSLPPETRVFPSGA